MTLQYKTVRISDPNLGQPQTRLGLDFFLAERLNIEAKDGWRFLAVLTGPTDHEEGKLEYRVLLTREYPTA